MTSRVYQHYHGLRRIRSGHRTGWWPLLLPAAMFALIVPTPKAWAQG